VGRPPIKTDDTLIIKMYCEDKLPSKQIGDRLDISWATIIRRLKKNKIAIHSSSDYPIWNKGLTVDTDERVATYSSKSKRNEGHHHTLSAKAKMSLARKGQNTWSKGRPLTLAHKNKIGETSKKHWEDSTYRQKVMASMKKKWADPEYKNRVRPLMLKGNCKKPTKPERKIIDLIIKHSLPLRYCGNGSFMIEGINPDFVNINGKKEVVEVFGDYWHGKGARKWEETEEGRKAVFASYGFNCIVLWEKEINTLPEPEILRRLGYE